MSRGGKRQGAGRKAVIPGEVRVNFSCRVSPKTKETIARLKAEGITIGEIIDRAIANYDTAKFMREFEETYLPKPK